MLGKSNVGPAATIYVSCMIACAGAISGDNMQVRYTLLFIELYYFIILHK